MSAFIGRERELRALTAAMDDVRGGRGRLLFLIGEPGIGKTRLADELCARAQDFRVLWGRCWEAGGAPAFWPWLEIVRELLATSDLAALVRELGIGAHVRRVAPARARMDLAR